MASVDTIHRVGAHLAEHGILRRVERRQRLVQSEPDTAAIAEEMGILPDSARARLPL